MKLRILFLFTALAPHLHAQLFQWAHGFGSQYQNNISTSVKYDKQGDCFISGYFRGTVDFDPGPAVHSLAASGRAMYIAKFDTYGNYAWAIDVDMGGNTYYGFTLDVDSAENVLLSGTFNGTADFDPGPGVYSLTSISNQDGLVAKYDANGNFVWAFTIGANGGSTFVASDNQADVIVCGGFTGASVDFDPGTGVSTMSTTGNANGTFIAKYDAGGNYLWSKSISSPVQGSSVLAESVSAMPGGDIIVSGFLNYTADFDPGPGVDTVSTSWQNKTFIARYDANGNFISVFAIQMSEYLHGTKSRVDINGNIFLGGSFQATADMDPGPGVSTLSALGYCSSFIAKYDPSGNLQWAHSFGHSSTYTAGMSLDCDLAGNVFLTGYFSDTVDFDPGPGVADLISDTARDAYVVRYDSNGNYTGGFNIPTAHGYSIAADWNGSIYLTGTFFSPHSDFDPEPPVYALTPLGQQDFYIAKYASLPLSVEQDSPVNEMTVFP
ncbi:MAG TPA: hypothetical protein VFU15_12165, partial [Bacteroidia bacterium]|nr:hypothetical protein [Bacteroidia bacterium]